MYCKIINIVQPLTNIMKRALKQITPPIIWEFARRVNKHFPVSNRLLDEDRRSYLENSYRKDNAGLSTDTMMFRPGLKMRIHPDSRNVFEYFCHTPIMVDEMNCFLEATRGKKRLLDIGALHGVFSLAFAIQNPERKALAVDASPIAFARLLYNINKNELSNIMPIECAISEKVGTLAMHYEWEHAVSAGTDHESNIITVPMTTGDSLCLSVDFLPDVIKIDVEGHEIKVLKGLRETIKENSPLIFLEVHPKRMAEEGDSSSYMEHFFEELHYSAQLVSGDPFPLSSFRNMDCDEQRLLLRKKAEQNTGGTI